MERVRAGLGGGIDLRGAPTELRRVGVALHLEFLNLVDGRNHGEGVEVRLRVGGAVQEEVCVLSAGPTHGVLINNPAADFANLREVHVGVFGESHAGGQSREVEEIAPVERQFHNPAVFDNLPHACRFRVQQGRGRLDIDRLRDLTHLQGKIEASLLIDLQLEGGHVRYLETLPLGAQGVVPGKQAGEREVTARGRHRVSVNIGVSIGDGDLDLRNHRAGTIENYSADTAGANLSQGRRGQKKGQRKCRQQSSGQPLPPP